MPITGFQTLNQLLSQAAATYRDRPCLGLSSTQGTDWWTYGDLERQSLRTAAWLHAQGIGRGDRVALWGPNRPQWVACFFGILALGGVAVPLDANSQPEFVHNVLARTAAKLLVLGSAQQKTLGATDFPIAVLDTLEEALPATGDMPVAVQPDDLAEIVFTSGTTSAPKGVMLTHKNIASNVQQSLSVIPVTPTERTMSLLPLSHMFEITAGMLTPLTAGASIVYLAALQPNLIFRTLERDGITCMLCVPQVLGLILNGIEREVDRQGKRRQWEVLHRIASWLPFGLRKYLFGPVHRRLGGKFEFFVVGGAALDPALAQRWEHMGVKVIQGYGTTETSPVISGHNKERRNPFTVGRPVPGLEVRIAEDGEILVRGPNVTQGYWQAPDLTTEAFTEGWYHTGDLGELVNGDLRLKGRKKNLIVLANGLNVHPEDVEFALSKEPDVAEAVVIGREKGREVEVHAVLLMKDPAAADAAVRSANRRLASHQRITGYTVWPEPDFPRTHTMKPKRADITAALDRLQPARG